MSSTKAASPPPPAVSLVAGMVAGAVEGFVTYPTEFVKTQLQLPNNNYKGPVDCLTRTVRERGIFGLYRGLSPLVVGNASKAGVRFLTFDQCKDLFINKLDMHGPSGLVVAGLAAGCMEGVLAVTPSETIKTKLIHDANKAVPQYKGLAHGVRTIIAQEGISGIYRGCGAVVARQGANSAVRMSSYSMIRERLTKEYPIDAKLGKPIVPWFVTFFSGGLAGVITVYATMPLDVVKTRLQSIGAKGSIVSNLTQVVKENGVGALWKGASPRLVRNFSGGIVFIVFESVVSIYNSLAFKIGPIPDLDSLARS